MQEKHTISLTKEQESIFAMLKSYRDQLELNTVLRVAGGWVRDKILGKQSHDIDIAIDNMKGEQFVTLIKECAEKHGEKISGFGVTKLNPDLSKHLQTATALIHEHWIDFVNLRSDKFSEENNIEKIGTPKQDAERRDFTMNSMFYNIDTGEVEDWTEKGLEDLKNGLIRTPIDPIQTLQDDPLRILRCIRFKTRFRFHIHKSIIESIQRPEIKELLQKRVSRERIGTELLGIIKSQNGLEGLRDLLQNGLWNIVLQFPQGSNLKQQQLIKRVPELSYTTAYHFFDSLQKHDWRSRQSLEQKGENNDAKVANKKITSYQRTELRILMMLTCLVVVYHPYSVEHGKAKSNMADFMVKKQLKYPVKYSKFVIHLCSGLKRLDELSASNIYDVIRWLRFAEQKWQLMIHLLYALSMAKKEQIGLDLFKLRDYILDKKLERSFLTEGPIDGSFLTQKNIKGPMVGRILQNSVIWQIVNPEKKRQQFIEEFEANPQYFQNQNTYRE